MTTLVPDTQLFRFAENSAPTTARRWMGAGLLTLLCLAFPHSGRAYAVLTHEAIVDSVWIDSMKPLLLKRFPNTTEDELTKAHAYAYGGCIIQDLGYYPFGSRFFSDLVHYVRSADFVTALLDEAQDVNELAFALGAVSHYYADIEGHSRAVNKAVPILFPKLKEKFGNEVTYADDPASHLKTEFGFDVLQVARANYAPKAYHDFIGFEVSKDLLDRAFKRTYGLTLKDLFRALDLSLGTYRFSVSNLLPNVTKTAWAVKANEIQKTNPTASRRQFLYNMKRSSYEREWGANFERPGFKARLLAFLLRIMPRIGPFKGIGFKVPTPQTEKMFEDSFDAAVKHDRDSFAQAKSAHLKISNRDLDTGREVNPGEYLFTDKTYDRLLTKLASKKFEGVTPELRGNILGFYAAMKNPDPHGIAPQLEALKAYTPSDDPK